MKALGLSFRQESSWAALPVLRSRCNPTADVKGPLPSAFTHHRRLGIAPRRSCLTSLFSWLRPCRKRLPYQSAISRKKTVGRAHIGPIGISTTHKFRSCVSRNFFFRSPNMLPLLAGYEKGLAILAFPQKAQAGFRWYWKRKRVLLHLAACWSSIRQKWGGKAGLYREYPVSSSCDPILFSLFYLGKLHLSCIKQRNPRAGQNVS